MDNKKENFGENSEKCPVVNRISVTSRIVLQTVVHYYIMFICQKILTKNKYIFPSVNDGFHKQYNNN